MVKLTITSLEDVRKRRAPVQLSVYGGLVAVKRLWSTWRLGELLPLAGIRKRAKAVDAEGLALLGVCQPLVGAASEAALVRQTLVQDGDPLIATRRVAQRTWNRFVGTIRFQFPAFFRACSGRLHSVVPRTEGGGTLVIDDTPCPKRGSHLPGIRKLFDHTKGVFYSGYELVTVALASAQGPAWPLAFAPQPMPPQHRKRKRGRPPPGTPPRVKVSKLVTALQLVEQALASGIRARLVVFDTWYTAVWLLKGLARLGLTFVAPVKRNRQLLWEGRWVQAQTLLRLAKRRVQRVFLVGLPGFGLVRVACVRRQLRHGGIQWEILITNDLTMSLHEMKKIYRRRWSIETLFEDAKQRFGLLHFHNRSMAAILAHLTFTFLAITVLLVLRALHVPLHALTLGGMKRSLVTVKALVAVRVGRWTVGFTENALCLKLFRGVSLCVASG